MMTNHDEVAEFAARLTLGVQPALQYLNARTPHRFTGVFSFRNDQLENLYLFDREDPYAEPWTTFPTRESYCAIVHDTGEPFVVGNATTDERVRDTPANSRVISYCGVALRTPNGHVFASLCHFDYRPINVAELDLDFLLEASALLAIDLAVV